MGFSLVLPSDRFHQAKAFFDSLADTLAHAVASMARRSAINGGGPHARVLRHMRRYVHRPQFVDKVFGVIPLSAPSYERRLDQARADLSAVNACFAIFDASGESSGTSPYIDTHRRFARGELMKLCHAALASGPKTTKELALCMIATKGLDTGDKVLAHVMAARLIHVLKNSGEAWKACDRMVGSRYNNLGH